MVIDIRTMKIPNLLTFPAAGVGIALNGFYRGADGALDAVLGWFLGAGITVVFSLLPIGSGKSRRRRPKGSDVPVLPQAAGGDDGWRGNPGKGACVASTNNS